VWYHIDPKTLTLTLTVHVQPGAKTTGAVGLYNDALKIRLSAPPVDGKANQALIDYLAKYLGVPVRQISLESGQQSRRKRLRIQGISALPAEWANFQ